MEPNVKEKLLQESERCRYSERPVGYRTCNTDECDNNKDLRTTSTTTTTESYEPRVDLIQNDISPGKCLLIIVLVELKHF